MNSTREVELHDGKVPRRRMVIASNCETLNLPLREPGGFGEVVYWASGCRTEDGVEIWTPGGHAPETKQEMNEVWVIAIRQNKTYGHGDFGTSWELQTTGPYNSGPPHPAFPSEEAAHAYIRQQPHAYLHMLPLRMELRAERPSD